MKTLLIPFACLIAVSAHLLPLSEAHDTPKQWLELHNTVRAKIGVCPLSWNKTLAQYARKYSRKRSGDCELIHSNGPYGENIYWGEGEGATDAAAAMKAWVDEECDFYDYNANCCLDGHDCLHYTQVIWNNTLQVGCGKAACRNVNKKVFITCNYHPPGNFVGERPY